MAHHLPGSYQTKSRLAAVAVGKGFGLALIMAAVLLCATACPGFIDGGADDNGDGGDDAPSVMNTRPVASFDFTPLAPEEGNAVFFDGTASWDREGPVVSYSWSYGDGWVGEGPQTYHPYSTQGSYSVRLEVRDGANTSATTTRPVEVAKDFSYGGVVYDLPEDPWPFRFSRFNYIGTDPSKESVTIIACGPGNLMGCTVVSSSGKRFSFDRSLPLNTGQEVILFSGIGPNGGLVLYWGQTSEVWSDDQGSAELVAPGETGPLRLDLWEYDRSR